VLEDALVKAIGQISSLTFVMASSRQMSARLSRH